jgi:sec-independent protein translocase protein TatA
MFNIRGSEWIIILALVLLIFGPSKLPSLARSIGQAVAELRSGVRKAQDDLEGLAKEVNPLADPPPVPKKPAPAPEPTQAAPKPEQEPKAMEEKKDDNVILADPDYPVDA